MSCIFDLVICNNWFAENIFCCHRNSIVNRAIDLLIVFFVCCWICNKWLFYGIVSKWFIKYFPLKGSLSLVKAVHFSRGLPTLLDISKGDRTKLTCCLEILPFKDNKITDSINNNNNNRTSINQNVSPTLSVPLLSPLPMNQWDQLSLQINWFLNNELLDTEKAKKLNINTNFVNGLATLSIDSVSTEHEGDYCCKVESSKGIIQTYGKIILKSE